MYAPVDLVQLDLALVPVVLVLDHLPRQVGPGPALLDVRAVVDQVLGSCPVLGAILLNDFFILREEDREAHQIVEVRDPPFQGHDQLVLANRFDPQARCRLLASYDLVSILDAREEV